MKRIALILSALSLAACNATMPLKPETPAQIAAQVCPPLQDTLTALSALVLEPKVAIDLAAADTAVKLACSAGAAFDAVKLNGSVVPVLIGAIKASPLADAQKNVLILDVTAAQIILRGALQAAANVSAS